MGVETPLGFISHTTWVHRSGLDFNIDLEGAGWGRAASPLCAATSVTGSSERDFICTLQQHVKEIVRTQCSPVKNDFPHHTDPQTDTNFFHGVGKTGCSFIESFRLESRGATSKTHKENLLFL